MGLLPTHGVPDIFWRNNDPTLRSPRKSLLMFIMCVLVLIVWGFLFLFFLVVVVYLCVSGFLFFILHRRFFFTACWQNICKIRYRLLARGVTPAPAHCPIPAGRGAWGSSPLGTTL